MAPGSDILRLRCASFRMMCWGGGTSRPRPALGPCFRRGDEEETREIGRGEGRSTLRQAQGERQPCGEERMDSRLRRPLHNPAICPTATPITLTSILSQDGRGGKTDAEMTVMQRSPCAGMGGSWGVGDFWQRDSSSRGLLRMSFGRGGGRIPAYAGVRGTGFRLSPE